MFPGTLCPVCAVARMEELRAKPKKPPREKKSSPEIVEAVLLLVDFGRMIPTLIQLCHPDRHNNSVGSNKATQWLLQARKRCPTLPSVK
jgi:hypothetical protein